MTITVDGGEIPGGRTPHAWPMKMHWGKAFTALRRLLSDKDDTGQVFEIMRALNGAATLTNYRRLLTTVEGGRIAYERAELAQRLMDDAWLDQFEDGTVGATYRDFVRSEALSAEGLADVSRDLCATRFQSPAWMVAFAVSSGVVECRLRLSPAKP